MTPTATHHLRLIWDDPSTGEPIEQAHPLPISIGRGEANGIILNSNRISRLHARIEKVQDRPVIRDLQSTNGTYVNQYRVMETVLEDGDLIQIGPFALTVDVHPFFDTPEAPGLKIKWTEPESGEEHEQVIRPPLTLGRDKQNDISLPTGRVSRKHALIKEEAGQIVLLDLESTNGTLVNGRRVTRAILKPGDVIRLGAYEIRVSATEWSRTVPELDESAVQPAAPHQATLIFTEKDDLKPVQAVTSSDAIDFPPAIFYQPVVPMAALQASGIEVEETTYLAVGGGLGSFVWVDYLRVFGAKPEQIAVIGLEDKPYGRYRRLCIHSQIPGHERLRSDSGSTPDCLWGWPGYAVREMWSSMTRMDFGTAFQAAWQIFGEPALAATYTPKSDTVFSAIDREAKRIGWPEMYRIGHVKAIRKTDDGRYVVAYTQIGQTGRRRRLIVAPYVHVAVGYPGVRFLPDLQRYRQETGDFTRVVNAYEEHEHVYDHLRQYGGVVMVRGRGIVASRIIQRIYEIRRENPHIGLLLLLRSPQAEGNRFGRAQRPVENHWEFQPFNWPKACWGGELRFMLEDANDETRDQLLNDWGGTTTADRTDWQEIMRAGLREGWYQIRFGSVRQVTLNEEGKLVTMIRGKGAITEETELLADFILDCTGLQASLDFNPLLKDLVEHHGLGRNPKGRLRVENDFELEGMRNGRGRLYAAGAMTLGGPYAAVDSFLGLQYAAMRSVEALRETRAPGLRGLNPLRSTSQWLRWARGAAP